MFKNPYVLSFLILIFVGFDSSNAADSIEKNMKAYEGVIIQENGALYIQTTDGIQLSIGKSFYAFLGRRVWVEADALVESAINIENIVVHQDSNFQFPRGQRVVLRGSLELDGKGGLEFYPNNQHALNLLGHRKSFKLKIDPRSGYASYKSETYLVQLEGIILGDTLQIPEAADSFRIIKRKITAKAGDMILISAQIYDNESRGGSYDFKTHGLGTPYFIESKDIAEYNMHNISDVYVQDSNTGEFKPAELGSSEMYASKNSGSLEDLSEKLKWEIEGGDIQSEKMTFVGQLKYNDLIVISDATVFAAEPPAVAFAKPGARLGVVEGGGRCNEHLTKKPKLYIVPK